MYKEKSKFNSRESEIILALVGDIIIRDPISRKINNNYEAAFKIIRDSDLAFANLENPLTHEVTPNPDYPTPLKGSSSLAEELAWMGFNAVSLANNHMMNYGTKGLLETMKVLNEKKIKYAGAGANITEAYSPAYCSVNALKIAFLAFCSEPPLQAERAYAKRPGLACVRAFNFLCNSPKGVQTVLAPVLWDVNAMEEAIGMARRNSDFVIVALHWHWVYEEVESHFKQNQDIVTHAAIDAGADMVVGHGPHQLRAIEKYKRKYIFYSLGNFIGQTSKAVEEQVIRLHHPERTWDVLSELRDTENIYRSIILRLSIKNSKVICMELIPIQIDKKGNNKGIPRLADAKVGKEIIEHLMELSSVYDVKISRKDMYGVIKNNL